MIQNLQPRAELIGLARKHSKDYDTKRITPRNLSMRMRQSVAEFSVGAPPRSLGAWVG